MSDNKKTFADKAVELFDKGFWLCFTIAFSAGLLGGFYELLLPLLSVYMQVFIKLCMAGGLICMCLSLIAGSAKKANKVK